MRSVLVASSLTLFACSNAPPINTPMCSTGQTACGSMCVDLQTSAGHCGVCGTACTADQSCIAATCYANVCDGTMCAASQVCSSGHCTERACVSVTCGAGQGCLGGSCISTSCGGTACPSGQLCVNGACADTSCFGVICPSGQGCQLGVCSATHCTDGTLDSDETDVDCGGSCPAKCRATQGCMASTDCATGVCTASHCAQAATCSDGKRNGSETDVDCGGTDCSLRCPVGSGCLLDGDCTSGTCASGVCAGPSCSDGKKNGTETDIDCGGVCTLKCSEGQHCGVPGDCTSLSCVGSVCTMPSCTDGSKNGTESDIDCGGSCPLKCALNDHCNVPTDCTTMSCASGLCAGPTCFDNAKNGSESDVDCGGSCAKKCPNGGHCAVPGDCVSVSCLSGLCTGSSCSDGVLNGSETDVDCGGTCSACADTLHCLVPKDCASGVCTAGVCQVPACNDMVKNGSESDVDCGGVCAQKCADGEMCTGPNDCANDVCNGTTCTGSSCFDGTRNGTETDIDCGGSCARKCNPGQACMVSGDCASGVCQGMTCGADPLNAGLQGYWTLNAADVNGSATLDASGHGNTSIFVGSFASAAGKIGEAVQFIGGTSYLSVGDDIDPTTAITLSAWIKTGPTGATQYLFNKWCTQACNDSDQAFMLQVDSSGTPRCYINGLNGSDLNVAGGSVVDNNWHLVTCTADKNVPGPNMVLYVDGAQVASAVVGGNVIHLTPDPLLIGQGVYGLLDDLRIYNRALSPSEVLSLSGMAYAAVPLPATALAASAVSSSEIDLSWVRSTSAGVTGYVVERSLTGSAGWFPVAVVGGAASTFSDVTLPAGTKFYYRVSAQTPSGSASPAGGASATTLAGVTGYSVPTGLLGYWTANPADITGTIETDASGNGNPAALVMSPPSVAGKIGGALQTSVGAYLSVSGEANPTTALSISLWVNTTQTATATPFNRWCTSACNDSDQQFMMQINRSASSGLATCYFNGVGGSDYNITSHAAVNDGFWHLIVCTGDAAGNGNNMKLYVDGVLDVDANVGTDLIHFTTDPLHLGQTLIGSIDDMRMYGRALTSTEIHTLYNNGSMGSP